MKLPLFEIGSVLAGVVVLVLSVAVLGAGVYAFWLLVKALEKYLAS